MITEDYVSFDISKLLKEKGFNEDCRDSYDWGGNFHLNASSNNGSVKKIAAPTLQMVMKWLREVHYKHCDVGYDTDLKWFIQIIDLKERAEHNYPENGIGFKLYEEACEAAIKYSLENLI